MRAPKRGTRPTSNSRAVVPRAPHPGNVSCNKATVPLAPNQINHVTLCQINLLCGAGGCVTMDWQPAGDRPGALDAHAASAARMPAVAPRR